MTKIKLFNHQEVALSHMRINDSFALFMEQGTGKTMPTLFRILELLKSNKIEDALVIGPKSTLGAWERDMEVFNDEDQALLQRSVYLVNYERVWRKSKGKQSPYDKAWGCIVLDEAHKIKNRTSKQSDFILRLGVNAKYKYILTGTPIGNGKLEDIWSQYCFLDPYIERKKPYSRIFGGSYYQFLDRYAKLNKFYQPSSYINVDELQDIIEEYSYRVKKEDCLDLPEKLPDEVIKVDLAEKKYYNDILKDSAILEHEILADNSLTRMLRLRQIPSGFMTDNDGELIPLKSEKMTALRDILEGRDTKLVIFAEFKHSIRSIQDLLKKMKLKHVTLDGDQKDKNIWRKFQSDDSIRVIVCQYQSASAGIDLFAADTIVYYEPTLVSTTLEQSRDRIHRTGQTTKCSYIHLITRGTVETQIYRALSNYGDFSEKLFTEYMDSYQRTFSR